jgi:hypothetical protein
MKRGFAAAVAVAVSTLAAAAGCDQGSAAVPTFEGGGTEDATLPGAGDAGPAYAVCPTGMDASFGSIYGLMLSTGSCGSTNKGCHFENVEASIFPASNLAYWTDDASAVYTELLGDGGGAPSFNADHPNVSVLRVDPGHADASMLYIKLTLVDASNDPMYGAGMPLTAPGSVCPEAVSAVADWINAGAPQN